MICFFHNSFQFCTFVLTPFRFENAWNTGVVAHFDFTVAYFSRRQKDNSGVYDIRCVRVPSLGRPAPQHLHLWKKKHSTYPIECLLFRLKPLKAWEKLNITTANFAQKRQIICVHILAWCTHCSIRQWACCHLVQIWRKIQKLFILKMKQTNEIGKSVVDVSGMLANRNKTVWLMFPWYFRKQATEVCPRTPPLPFSHH